jgi:hypothetical protein
LNIIDSPGSDFRQDLFFVLLRVFSACLDVNFLTGFDAPSTGRWSNFILEKGRRISIFHFVVFQQHRGFFRLWYASRWHAPEVCHFVFW